MKVKTSTDSAAMAGRIRGSTMYQKMRHSLTPSTRAASISSNGSALMKFRMNRVQNPVWKAMWNSARPYQVSYMPSCSVMSRTGTIRIWNGTKLPATNMKNTRMFARNP